MTNAPAPAPAPALIATWIEDGGGAWFLCAEAYAAGDVVPSERHNHASLAKAQTGVERDAFLMRKATEPEWMINYASEAHALHDLQTILMASGLEFVRKLG